MHTILQLWLGNSLRWATNNLTQYWLIRSANVPTPQPTINAGAYHLIGVRCVPIDIGNSATVGMQHVFNCHLPIEK